MKVTVSTLLAILVAGCASSSPIAQYGKDTYIIGVDDVWGGYSPGKLQGKAAQKANAFCAKQGKVVRVRNTTSEGTQGWTSTSSNLIFSCIDESDPENARLNRPGYRGGCWV